MVSPLERATERLERLNDLFDSHQDDVPLLPVPKLLADVHRVSWRRDRVELTSKLFEIVRYVGHQEVQNIQVFGPHLEMRL